MAILDGRLALLAQGGQSDSLLPKSGSLRSITVYDCPNHDGPRLTTAGIILHSTRSGRFTRAEEYQKTIDYFMAPGTPASSHRVIGVLPGQHALLVADDLIAWHAQEDNRSWLSIEFAQPFPDDPYSDWQIEEGVAVCVVWCRKYGVVPSAETIMSHSGTAQGKRDGKSDPGPLLDYADFIERVKLLTTD